MCVSRYPHHKGIQWELHFLCSSFLALIRSMLEHHASKLLEHHTPFVCKPALTVIMKALDTFKTCKLNDKSTVHMFTVYSMLHSPTPSNISLISHRILCGTTCWVRRVSGNVSGVTGLEKESDYAVAKVTSWTATKHVKTYATANPDCEQIPRTQWWLR